MKLKEVIIDADFCIKLGGNLKYPFLERVLKELAEKVYMHKIVYDEVMTPASAKMQIDTLKNQGFLELLDENTLTPLEKTVYQNTYAMLAGIMINPNKPRKNQGETCSLAMAKTKSIPYFVTDERNLQPIIDTTLNGGIDDIFCLRIEDVIKKIRDGGL